MLSKFCQIIWKIQNIQDNIRLMILFVPTEHNNNIDDYMNVN